MSALNEDHLLVTLSKWKGEADYDVISWHTKVRNAAGEGAKEDAFFRLTSILIREQAVDKYAPRGRSNGTIYYCTKCEQRLETGPFKLHKCEGVAVKVVIKKSPTTICDAAFALEYLKTHQEERADAPYNELWKVLTKHVINLFEREEPLISEASMTDFLTQDLLHEELLATPSLLSLHERLANRRQKTGARKARTKRSRKR